ncbi:MAG: aminotransferase class III-fold pyridoxal phosphate-dependent enzyme [Cytophagales bacterium]|nr:aminotransferase class III-fold pyridoxal phosphate-dependent enzyme [Cytophagales bacterium]
MNPIDVYPVYDITPHKAEGAYVWDDQGTKYLDFYGGHAVISIGHTHPHYVQRINDQLGRLGFYSNSIRMPIQQELATKLGELSGYADYDVFFCNSGAEATENAIKAAGFSQPEKSKIIVFEKGFHGRTSMAVSCTDNKKVQTQFDNHQDIIRLPLNDLESLKANFNDQICAVMVEGMLGIGGIHVPSKEFLAAIRSLCDEHGAVMILDEIQSGYGRSGVFFAHQLQDVKADVVTMAKGMGNGFPIGGVLVSPEMTRWKGMLGSTFGGNHLACAAGLAVLEVMEKENLLTNAQEKGAYLKQELSKIEQVKEIRGAGLMLGLVMDQPVADIRKSLVFDHQVFTGSSSEPNVLRLLPPLSIDDHDCDQFLEAFRKVLAS